MGKHTIGASVIALIAGAGGVPGAIAQDGAAAAGASPRDAVDQIYVYSQRRREEQQSVPIAVTAFNAQGLEERGVEQLRDVTDYVPNLNIESTVGVQGSARIFLRGIGQDDLNSESPVALYVDDIYFGAQPGTMLDLYEIAGLEVLRGPQGTLYGRNSNAGAIRVTTRRPSQEFRGAVEGGYGEHDYWQARGSLDGPLSESLAGQAAFLVRQRDGFSTIVDDANPMTPPSALAGQKINDQDTIAGRVALNYVSGPWDVLLSADIVRDRSDPFLPAALDDGRSGFASGDLDGMLPENPDGDIFTIETNLGSPTIFPDLSFFPFTSASDAEIINVPAPLNEIDAYSAALNASYDFSAAELKSVTAFRNTKHEVYTDLDGQMAHKFAIYQDLDARQFTQELQLASTGDSRLSWLAGFFFYHEDSELNVREEGAAARPAGTSVAPEVDFDGPGPAPAFNFPPGSLAAPTITTDRTTNSYAGFASLTFAITEMLGITGGVRYTYEKRDIDYSADVNALVEGGAILPLSFSRDFSDVSWRAVAEFEPTDDFLAYFSVATGFTAGDYNRRGANTAIFSDFLDPEEITSYELGFKSDLFDNRLRLNADIFQLDYDDFQTSLFDFNEFVFRRLNAGDVRYRGVEVESRAALGGVGAFFNLGYLDAEYKSVTPDAAMLGFTTALEPQKAPEWTIGGGMDVTLPVADIGEFYAGLSSNFVDSQISNVNNTANASIDSRTVLNGRIAFETGNWTIAVIGRNLTNKTYLSNKVDIPALDITSGTAAPPRTISVSVKAAF